MINETLHRLNVGAGDAARPVAVRVLEGALPGLFWLGGFKSDMGGTKAAALAAHAQQTGRAIVRFDYSGHGESGGRFRDGTISRWLEEARAVFETFTTGPQILIGSSMGGWIALLLAREFMQRPAARGRVKGLVLIAPAADFTEALMWTALPEAIKREIEDKGVWMRPSAYDDGPYPITRELIEDGRKHLVLNAPFETGCPVRILQGSLDPDVPWQHAMKLVACLPKDDVAMTLVKDGDHRLSRPEDIERLLRIVDDLAAA